MKKILAVLCVLIFLPALASAQVKYLNNPPPNTDNPNQPSIFSPTQYYQQYKQASNLNGSFPFCTNGTCTYIPLEPLPGFPTTFGAGGAGFGQFIQNIFTLLIWAGGIIAVVTLILGGISYMTSAVVVTKMVGAERMRASLWGLALLLVSYLILRTINPQLVDFNQNLVAQQAVGITQQAPSPSGPTAPPASDSTLPNTLTSDQQQAALGFLNSCSFVLDCIGTNWDKMYGSMLAGSGDLNKFISDCETPIRFTYSGTQYHAVEKTISGSNYGGTVDAYVCVFKTP